MSADRIESDRPPWDVATSRSVLAGAKDDAPAAWVRLVNLYAPLAATWFRKWGVAEQDIVDCLQEVFSAVAKNLDRFRKEQPDDTFRGWLATIAKNKARDYHRRRAGQPAAVGGTEASLRLAQLEDCASEDDECPPHCDAALNAVLRQALDAIRGDFHEPTWQAFWNVVVEGRSTADVAAELGMQPGAVRVAKSRVLARLRKELGDQC
jgi:RNA polymerase sigma-70 factor (ECF subfamily)